MLMRRNWRAENRGKGIGLQDEKFRNDTTHEYMATIFCQVRVVGNIPFVAHRSQAADVAKANGKLRILPVLDSTWATWYTVRYDEIALASPPLNFEHGYYMGRRREDAIAVPCIVTERLTAEEISHAWPHHDMTNSFACTTNEAHDAFLQDLNADEFLFSFFQQRSKNSTVLLQATDGEINFSPTLGIQRCSAESSGSR